jgi:peptidoglycan/xylan/chitin deacetylase (PgdA/CDA1 family)
LRSRRSLATFAASALVIAVLGTTAVAVTHLGRSGPAVTTAARPGPQIQDEALRPPVPTPQTVVPLGREHVHVPILEYHYVRTVTDPRDRLGFALSVTPADFSEQMRWLHQNDYHPVGLRRLRAYLQGLEPLPARPVVLTFDDGYLDFYTTAFPILSIHSFTAVSYVVPDFFSRRSYMSPAEIAAIDGAGIEVASHTLDHVDLTKASPAELDRQLQESRSRIERLLGHPVVDFCYPSGRFNAAVVSAVGRAGYESATTELPGADHGWAERLTWTRVRVNGGETLPQFTASLGPSDPTVTVTPGPTASAAAGTAFLP